MTRLKIGGCDHSIIKKFVNEFPDLYSLDISHSRFNSLHSLRLEHKNVVKLNISHNNLIYIAKEFFSQLPNVTELDFSYNHINFVDNFPKNLVSLHLSYNSELSLILEDDFKDFLDLKYLNLINDRLSFVVQPILQLLRRGIFVDISWKEIRAFYADSDKTNRIHVVVDDEKEGIFLNASNKTVELYCKEGSFENIDYATIYDDGVENLTELLKCFASSLKCLDQRGKFSDELNTDTIREILKAKRGYNYTAESLDTIYSRFYYDSR